MAGHREYRSHWPRTEAALPLPAERPGKPRLRLLSTWDTNELSFS